MTLMHTTDEDLLRYVTDDLALEQAQALEAHVHECAHCQRRLREHAELEVFCSQLGEQLQPARTQAPPVKEPSGRGLCWGIASLASVLLCWLPSNGRLPAPSIAAKSRPRPPEASAPAHDLHPAVNAPEHVFLPTDETFAAFTRPQAVAMRLSPTPLIPSVGNINAGILSSWNIPCSRGRQC